MRKILDFLTNGWWRRGIDSYLNRKSVDMGVKQSIKKYGSTYELLEEYDRRNLQSPEELADPGRLREFVQKVQRTPRVQ